MRALVFQFGRKTAASILQRAGAYAQPNDKIALFRLAASLGGSGAARRRAILSLRLRLHSGLRQRGGVSDAVFTQAFGLGWYIVGPLALRVVAESDFGGELGMGREIRAVNVRSPHEVATNGELGCAGF